MDINELLVLMMFVSFVALLFTGFPVGYVLAGIGVIFAMVGYLSDEWFDSATGLDYLTLGLVINRIYKGVVENWILVALPMFIFMGNMLNQSGTAERMLRAFQSLFGRLHGGLAISVIVIGIILAASTGIIGASVVLLTVMSLPLMMKQGYSVPLASGAIAAPAHSASSCRPPSCLSSWPTKWVCRSVICLSARFIPVCCWAFFTFFIFLSSDNCDRTNSPCRRIPRRSRANYSGKLYCRWFPPLF